MNAYVLLGLSVGIFLILQTIWKTKGVQVFLLLCAGNILSASFAGATATFLQDILQNSSLPISQICKIILLLAPAVLAILISKGSAKKKHTFIYILVNICSVALAYLWLIRTLPYEQFSNIESLAVTKYILSARDAILAAGVVLSLLFMLFDGKKKDKHEKHKKD